MVFEEGGNVWHTRSNRTRPNCFFSGRSQAVRLPLRYRIDSAEVFIRRDDSTGDIILSRVPQNAWTEFCALVDRTELPDDFLSDRDTRPAEERDLS
jgi:antitoxin VapB